MNNKCDGKLDLWGTYPIISWYRKSRKKESMELNEYQLWTRSTAIYPKEYGIIYCGLGLANEAGEVAGKIKKVIRDNNADFTSHDAKAKIVDEVSDCLWYAVRLLDELGVDAEELIAVNTQKLNSRKERGVLGGSGDTR